MGRSVAPPNGHVTQLGEGGLGVSGTIKTRQRSPAKLSLSPRTGNLHFEEVVSRVLQENWEKHKRAKERFRSSLNSSHCRWTRLTRELGEMSQGMEGAADRKVHKDIEERMGML